MKNNIIRLIVFYLIGFALYFAMLYLAQNIVLNVLEISREEIHILFDNFLLNILMYTVLYAFVVFMLYVYDQTSVRELNEALKEMKERVKSNEEQIRSIRDNNNYSNSGNIGSI